jgi:geranylgeranyl reductase family protein
MSRLYDVAVVGAGPAGATAARDLASAGASVVLLEKEDLPRYKTCGGGVVYRARSLAGVDLAAVVEREFHGARMTLLDSGLTFETIRPEPIISMTMRSSLDALLVVAADSAGADVRPRTAIRGLSDSGGVVTLATSAEPVTAKFVIAADGALSTIARLAGWTRETRRLAAAIEAEVYVSDRDLARHGQVRFDFDLPPHGYGWVFPKRDHLSIGIASVTRERALSALFARYLRGLGLERVIRQERHGFVIPVSPRRDGLVRSRVLLAGDSAGFADPVTGEGISFAIRSGRLAARALLDARLDVARVADAYERSVRRELSPELSVGRVLAKVLYASPRLRTWVFRRYGPRLAEAVTDIFMGSRTYARAVASPRSYWQLLHATARGQ